VRITLQGYHVGYMRQSLDPDHRLAKPERHARKAYSELPTVPVVPAERPDFAYGTLLREVKQRLFCVVNL